MGVVGGMGVVGEGCECGRRRVWLWWDKVWMW